MANRFRRASRPITACWKSFATSTAPTIPTNPWRSRISQPASAAQLGIFEQPSDLQPAQFADAVRNVVDDFQRAASLGPLIVIPGNGQQRFGVLGAPAGLGCFGFPGSVEAFALDLGDELPGERVELDGAVVEGIEERVVYALHKPAGVVSTGHAPPLVSMFATGSASRACWFGET